MFNFVMQMNAIAISLDGITMQMDAIPLLENQFNGSLFQFHLFVATKNGGTEDIRSKANKDLKAWSVDQDNMCQSHPPLDPTDMQLHEQIKVLDHIKFRRKESHQDM